MLLRRHNSHCKGANRPAVSGDYPEAPPCVLFDPPAPDAAQRLSPFYVLCNSHKLLQQRPIKDFLKTDAKTIQADRQIALDHNTIESCLLKLPA